MIVAWRCPVCRASGDVDAPTNATPDALDALIDAAHHSKQPRCAGFPLATGADKP